MTISLTSYRTPTTTTLDSIFDSLFDPFFESMTIPKKRTASSVNTIVTTEDDKYIISVNAPGLDKEDFNILVTDGVLSVSATGTTTEFGTTSFEKTWILPEAVATDDITAKYIQGILRVHIEKPRQDSPQAATIKVS